MTRKLSALAVAAALATAVFAAPTTADARNGRVAAGVIGGLAAGAIIGGALASPYYYPAPGYYYAPYGAYYGPPCYVRRVWTPFGWQRERVCY